MLVIPAMLGAQAPAVPRSVWLEWQNVRVVMSPDPAGTFLWVQSDAQRTAKGVQSFGRFLDPAKTTPWIAGARAFIREQIPEADTATSRTSPMLDFGDARIFLARRRLQGAWTTERFIVLESLLDSTVLINGDETSVGEILDSLEVVTARTPYSASAHVADSLVRLAVPRPTYRTTPRADNRPPVYPRKEFESKINGTVLVQFVVRPEGYADTATVKVIHATSAGFLGAVLEALPRLRFRPAITAGAEVSDLVVMPFSFAVIRR